MSFVDFISYYDKIATIGADPRPAVMSRILPRGNIG